MTYETILYDVEDNILTKIRAWAMGRGEARVAGQLSDGSVVLSSLVPRMMIHHVELVPMYLSPPAIDDAVEDDPWQMDRNCAFHMFVFA